MRAGGVGGGGGFSGCQLLTLSGGGGFIYTGRLNLHGEADPAPLC